MRCLQGVKNRPIDRKRFELFRCQTPPLLHSPIIQDSGIDRKPMLLQWAPVYSFFTMCFYRPGATAPGHCHWRLSTAQRIARSFEPAVCSGIHDFVAASGFQRNLCGYRRQFGCCALGDSAASNSSFNETTSIAGPLNSGGLDFVGAIHDCTFPAASSASNCLATSASG